MEIIENAVGPWQNLTGTFSATAPRTTAIYFARVEWGLGACWALAIVGPVPFSIDVLWRQCAPTSPILAGWEPDLVHSALTSVVWQREISPVAYPSQWNFRSSNARIGSHRRFRSWKYQLIEGIARILTPSLTMAILASTFTHIVINWAIIVYLYKAWFYQFENEPEPYCPLGNVRTIKENGK